MPISKWRMIAGNSNACTAPSFKLLLSKISPIFHKVKWVPKKWYFPITFLFRLFRRKPIFFHKNQLNVKVFWVCKKLTIKYTFKLKPSTLNYTFRSISCSHSKYRRIKKGIKRANWMFFVSVIIRNVEIENFIHPSRYTLFASLASKKAIRTEFHQPHD